MMASAPHSGRHVTHPPFRGNRRRLVAVLAHATRTAAWRVLPPLFIVLGSAMPAAAQAPDCAPLRGRVVNFLFENDVNWLAVLGQSDDEYTTGVRFSGLFRRYPGRWAVQPDFWSWWPDNGTPTARNYCFTSDWSIGLNIYTPHKTESTDFIANDRPYVGWTYLAYSKNALLFDGETLHEMRTFEVSVGLIGDWAGGRIFQNGAHHLFRVRLPDGSIKEAMGWPHQMKREVGISISNRLRRRFYERTILVARPDGTQEQSRFADTVLDSDITVGTVFNHMGGGVTGRLGFNLGEHLGPIEGPRSSLGSQRGSQPTPQLPRFPAIHEPPHLPEMFVFGRIGGRGVWRNIFLDESFFHDKTHTIEREPLVFELEAGVAVRLSRVMITWRTVRRSPEFRRSDATLPKLLEQKPPQLFGSLTVTYDFRR